MTATRSEFHANEGPAFPRGLALSEGAAGRGVYLRPLDGGAGRMPARCEVLLRTPDGTAGVQATTDALQDWARAEGAAVAKRVNAILAHIAQPRAPFAGLTLDEGPLVMGVINVTPDSFSDGGRYLDADRAIARGRELAAAGAAILDVGGESTRPGAAPVSPEEEKARVLPVVRALAGDGLVVSIDSRRASVIGAALAAGARIANDVTALTGDPESLKVTAAAGAGVVLMHMQGEPGTMQRDPRYDDALLDIYDYLEARVAACEAGGISPARIAVDPGIGFGKTVDHNLRLLGRIGLFHGLGCAILLGVSRKSFIGRLSADAAPDARLAGSVSATLAGIAQGVQIVRVHDVAETRQAVAVWEAIVAAVKIT